MSDQEHQERRVVEVPDGYILPKWFAWVLSIAISLTGVFVVPAARSIATNVSSLSTAVVNVEKQLIAIDLKLSELSTARAEMRKHITENSALARENEKRFEKLELRVNRLERPESRP